MKSLIFLSFFILFFSSTQAQVSLQGPESPDDGKWLKFYEEAGITLYRAGETASGLIPFKASGVFAGPLESYLMVLLHHDRKPTWAPKLKSVKVHKRIDSNTFIFSEYYKTPWPAADREFLLVGKVRFMGPNHVRLEAVNAQQKNLKDAYHILCDVKLLNLDLKKVSSNKTAITFEFYGDMMGWMPVWLINLIQKKWPMRFLKGLSDQVATGKAIATKEYLGLERPSRTR